GAPLHRKRRERGQLCLPTWSPITPPMAAPPTVPRTPPPVITAPATPPRPAPVTADFWRWLMLSQDEHPAIAVASSKAALIFPNVLIVMLRLLFLIRGVACHVGILSSFITADHEDTMNQG